jgi:hypothetical protein
MSKVDVELTDSDSSLESDVTKNESVVVHSPEIDPSLNDASPTYITIETTDGQLEHVKVKRIEMI